MPVAFGDKRLPERFWKKVFPDGYDCWIWMAARTSQDYGLFSISGKSRLAHRISYEALAGPIGTSLCIDHLCRVRPCVNPHHLEPVTPAENIRRGEATRARLEKTHCKKGHPYSGGNLYLTPMGWRDCRDCKRERNLKSKRKRADANREINRERARIHYAANRDAILERKRKHYGRQVSNV